MIWGHPPEFQASQFTHTRVCTRSASTCVGHFLECLSWQK